MEQDEAAEILERAKKLHAEAGVHETARKSVLEKRNLLIRSLHPEDPENSWYSPTEIARELGITFGAIKKVIAPPKPKGKK